MVNTRVTTLNAVNLIYESDKRPGTLDLAPMDKGCLSLVYAHDIVLRPTKNCKAMLRLNCFMHYSVARQLTRTPHSHQQLRLVINQ